MWPGHPGPHNRPHARAYVGARCFTPQAEEDQEQAFEGDWRQVCNTGVGGECSTGVVNIQQSLSHNDFESLAGARGKDVRGATAIGSPAEASTKGSGKPAVPVAWGDVVQNIQHLSKNRCCCIAHG